MTKFSVALLATTIAVVAAIYGPEINVPAVGTYPFLVSIQQNYEPLPRHVCGGAIISPEYVLTSADCFEPYANDKFDRLMAGSIRINDGGSLHLITDRIIHEDYEKKSNNNNIAILKVSPKFHFGTDINSIPLETRDFLESSYFAGWGSFNNSGYYTPSGIFGNYYDYPDVLQHVELKIISNKECSDYKINVLDEQMCTLTHIGQGLGYNDHGGPLITKDTKKLLAIANKRCSCGSGLPDVYTKVKPFITWINKTCHCI